MKNLVAVLILVSSVPTFADDPGVKTNTEASAVVNCATKVRTGSELACTGVKTATEASAVVFCASKVRTGSELACTGLKTMT